MGKPNRRRGRSGFKSGSPGIEPEANVAASARGSVNNRTPLLPLEDQVLGEIDERQSLEQDTFGGRVPEDLHAHDSSSGNYNHSEPPLVYPPSTSSAPPLARPLGISAVFPQPLQFWGPAPAGNLQDGEIALPDTLKVSQKTVQFTRFPREWNPKQAQNFIEGVSEEGVVEICAHELYKRVMVWARYETMDIAIAVIERLRTKKTSVRGEIIDAGPRTIWTPGVEYLAHPEDLPLASPPAPIRAPSLPMAPPTPPPLVEHIPPFALHGRSRTGKAAKARPASEGDQLATIMRTIEIFDFLPGVNTQQAEQTIEELSPQGLISNQARMRNGRLTVHATYINPKAADDAMRRARTAHLRCSMCSVLR